MKTPQQTEREAAALRTNLLKRKARQRALNAGEAAAEQPPTEVLRSQKTTGKDDS